MMRRARIYLWLVKCKIGAISKWLGQPPTAKLPGWLHSLLLFLEQPLFTFWAGIILSALVGLFFRPMFYLCGVFLVLTLHKSGALTGKSRIIQLSGYLTFSAIAFFSLYKLYPIVQAKFVETNTAFAKLVASFVSQEQQTVPTKARTVSKSSPPGISSTPPLPKPLKPRSSDFDVGLVPYVITERSAMKIGTDEAFGVHYGFGAVLRILNNGRPTNVRELDVNGDVDVDCQFYMVLIAKHNKKLGGRTVDEVGNDCGQFQPFVRLSWRTQSDDSAFLDGGDERYLKFRIISPGTFMQQQAQWENIGSHTGHIRPVPISSPSLFDLVRFTRGVAGEHPAMNELRDPVFRPEVYRGKIKFIVRLDGGSVEVPTDAIKPIRQVFYRIEYPERKVTNEGPGWDNLTPLELFGGHAQQNNTPSEKGTITTHTPRKQPDIAAVPF